MTNKKLTSLGVCGLFLIANALGQVQPKREWGPEQATGAPDTMEAGDLPTAWASLEPDAGPEWLEVSFAKAVEIDEVRIRETFNPGAVCKIVAISKDKIEIVLWEGDGNPIQAPADMVVRPVQGIKSDRIKIHLDSKRIHGCNEIDAVEIIGADGSRQWATSATASSFYVSQNSRQAVGKDEFLFELMHINQPDADKYLVSAQNVRKYKEWQSPPASYWGPTTNGVEGELTYKFPLPGNATQIFLKASSLTWDFFNEPGGTGKGCSNLEASRDGVTWIPLENKMNPRQWGADWFFENTLPQELLGKSEIWIRVKMLVESASNSSYTVAQFARGHPATTDPVFVIRATANPNPKDLGASATPAISKMGEMVSIEGGTLPQGSELAGQAVDSFQIGKYEVTWGLWKEVRDWAVANNTGYDLEDVGKTYPEESGDNFPVVYVSWYDALKWCNARSEKDGLNPVYQVNWETYKSGQIIPVVSNAANGYRLPIEKEWEWAARGGVSSKGYTYSGSNDVEAVAWTFENSKTGTQPVGAKVANELGIHDMSGNVYAWCWDQINANRRLRGGSYYFGAERSAIAVRKGLNPDGRYGPFGFRVAMNAAK
jgi:formylglycine-generating enzyme required for sulfatase activity